MILVNNLAPPGGIKRIELSTNCVRVRLWDGTEMVFISANGSNPNDKVIADNMRDYWKHQADGADRHGIGEE